MSGIPDFALETTYDHKFTTRQFSDGAPVTLAGGVVDIYEDNSITEITGAETLTLDFDGRTGLHNLRIAMTAANGFATDSSYSAVITTGTVGGTSVVGEVIFNFTIEKQSALRPTVDGRTLDVLATGEAGVDLGNVAGVLGNANVGWIDGSDRVDVGQFLSVAVAAATASGEINSNVREWLETAVTLGAGAPDVNVQSMDANSIAGGTISAAELTNIEDEIWNALKAAHVVANSFGDFLDIEVSGRSSHSAADVWAVGTRDLTALGFVLGNSDASWVDANDRIDVGRWISTVVTLSAGAPDVNVQSMDAASIAAGVLSAATLTEIEDAVWDALLTGVFHNIPTSAGRILRELREAGNYSNGALYLDTNNGTAGTTDFENGTDARPSLTLADANTLAASRAISMFAIAPRSSLEFVVSQENQSFTGENWVLDLSGESISGSHFRGAEVTGIGTGANESHFEHCEMGTCTLAKAHLDFCDLEATIILSAADTYRVNDCYHAGGVTTIDFGAVVGNTTLHLHNFHGAITIENMGQAGTDVLHWSSPDGKLTLAASCVGGTVNMNGTFDFVNNGSGLTINDNGAILEVLGVPIGIDFSADFVAIKADTALISGLNNISVTDIFTGTPIESYAAPGATPTFEQFLYMTMQDLAEFSNTGVTRTVEKLDGSTAMTFTYDDAANPTSRVRAT